MSLMALIIVITACGVWVFGTAWSFHSQDKRMVAWRKDLDRSQRIINDIGHLLDTGQEYEAENLMTAWEEEYGR